MRIALVAPPFISVPPARYGGTELFVAHLATYLHGRGHDVVVYANGESDLPCEVRSLYPRSEWPIQGEIAGSLKDLDHTTWALADAAGADVVHLNNAPGLALSRLVPTPFVYTMHHPHETVLSDFYRHHPRPLYVTISDFQQAQETMPRMVTIRHGIDLGQYPFVERKQDYLVFLGRIAPVKAPHLAIEAARKAGIPLKLAGEVQPVYQGYWESEVEPFVDGTFIEYVGEADHSLKCELLGNARALLFPIQWHEPFGLVMVEAMACGTPVLALPGGAVAEVVRDGVSGWIARDSTGLASRAVSLSIPAASCRAHAAAHFTVDIMGAQYEVAYRRAVAEQAGEEPAPVEDPLIEALAGVAVTPAPRRR